MINTRAPSTQTFYALRWKLLCTPSTGRRLTMNSMSLGLKLVVNFMKGARHLPSATIPWWNAGVWLPLPPCEEVPWGLFMQAHARCELICVSQKSTLFYGSFSMKSASPNFPQVAPPNGLSTEVISKHLSSCPKVCQFLMTLSFVIQVILTTPGG